MLGLPLRYLLKHPVSGVADLAADPLEIWSTMYDDYVYMREQREPQIPIPVPDNGWEARLHEALGVAWPCGVDVGVLELIGRRSSAELEAKGIRAGPGELSLLE